MTGKKHVTLRDIAEELGLTVHTVSKALRGLPGMSEATRRDVFETARRLGYKTKEQELSLGYEKVPLLTTKRRRFTMMLSHDAPFFRMQLRGIQERLHELGHTVSVSFVPEAIRTAESFEHWLEFSDLLYSDGIFIPPATPEFLESTLQQLPLPKVLINYPPPLASVDSVIWDVAHAIHLSVNHLVSMGHRRILYVGDIYAHRGFQIRWQAFREAMRAIGSDPDPADHITRSSGQIDLWIPELKDKLVEGKYSAILCSVDQDLAKIFYAVHSLGRSIPDDYSLISFENMEHPLFPKLARPELLIKETGSRAAERLLWRIANPDLPHEHIRLQGGFLPGDTVARAK